MVITQPTVDDFSDTTVMRVIRKIVNYLCNDLIDGINDNDIVSGEFTIKGDQLSGILTKGDGTTIDIPATTLPSGGGGSDNPYPTAVSMTLSGTTLNFNMTMSNGTPITGSVDLASILEGYATDAGVTEIQTNLQEQINGLTLISSGNQMSINGTNANIINSVEGSVSGNNLTVSVNGVNSSSIELPSADANPNYSNANGKFNITTFKNYLKTYVSNGGKPGFITTTTSITTTITGESGTHGMIFSGVIYYSSPIVYIIGNFSIGGVSFNPIGMRYNTSNDNLVIDDRDGGAHIITAMASTAATSVTGCSILFFN